MKTQTIFILLFGVVLVFYFIWSRFIKQKKVSGADTAKPSYEYLPEEEKQNDNLVIIENVTTAEVDSILTGFCNMYNEEVFQVKPRLYTINERYFAITFPYDIEFEIYCYFLNYVHYSLSPDRLLNVKGWATTKSGQDWITDKTANEQVMLFIPTDDTEYDNVYMTTSDNIGYKIGFSMGEEEQLLDFPKEHFIVPKIKIEELINKEYKDYK